MKNPVLNKILTTATLFSVFALNPAGAYATDFQCGQLTPAQVTALHNCKATLFSEAAKMRAKGKVNMSLLQAHHNSCVMKIGCKKAK